MSTAPEPGEEAPAISYRLREEDYLAREAYTVLRLPLLRRFYLLDLAAFTVLYVLIAWHFPSAALAQVTDRPPWLVWLVLYPVALVVLAPCRLSWKVRNARVRARKGLDLSPGSRDLDVRTVSIDGSGVKLVSDYGWLHAPWAAAFHLGVTRGQLLIYLGQNAEIVPAHAFEDQQDFEAFVRLARRLRDAAGPAPAPPAPPAGALVAEYDTAPEDYQALQRQAAAGTPAWLTQLMVLGVMALGWAYLLHSLPAPTLATGVVVLTLGILLFQGAVAGVFMAALALAGAAAYHLAVALPGPVHDSLLTLGAAVFLLALPLVSLLLPPVDLIRRLTESMLGRAIARPHFRIALGGEVEVVYNRLAICRHPWRAWVKVAATPTHVIFFLKPDHAYLVPRRAFPGEEGFEAFAAAARRWHEEALGLADRPADVSLRGLGPSGGLRRGDDVTPPG